MDTLGKDDVVGAVGEWIPTVLLWAVFWQALYVVSGPASSLLFGSKYKAMEAKYKHQWAERFVGFMHAVAIVSMVTPLFLGDEALRSNRLFGSSPRAEAVIAFTTGYFLWDASVCLLGTARDPSAWPFALHGVICFVIYVFAFRPYLQFYACVFLIFEASTPVLHAIWVIDHFKYDAPRVRLVLGVALLLVYFLVRICFSFYWTYYYVTDTYAAADKIPLAFHIIYGLANVALNSLNVYWFSLILGRVIKHFSGRPEKEAKKKH